LTRVTVRLFGGAAEAFGSAEAEVDGVDGLAGLVAELVASGGDRTREVLDQCSFFVDGEHTRDLDTPLADRSAVDVLPPFAGG